MHAVIVVVSLWFMSYRPIPLCPSYDSDPRHSPSRVRAVASSCSDVA